MEDDPLYRRFAIAYLNGAAGTAIALDDETADLRAIAAENGLKIHRFKRSGVLPRVAAALGVLRGIAPANLLDVGTGRGAFLWPFLEAFPDIPTTCIDILEHRVAMLSAVARGGIGNLNVVRGEGGSLPFADGAFDSATALEVLEHQAEPILLARELVRVTRRFVVVSVPSKPDDNPEHVQLFTADSLRALFLGAGARSVTASHVPGHIVAVVRL